MMIDLNKFLVQFQSNEFISRIAKQTGLAESFVRYRINAYLNEVPIGLDVARRGLAYGTRILEIGAGMGFLSYYLRANGYNITALELMGAGFDSFKVEPENVKKEMAGIDLPVLPISVTDLSPAKHGMFDFIFSVYVIEHVPDMDGMFRAMASVLREGGTMVHLCPNYIIPYEPHYSLPLVPLIPSLTTNLISRQIREQALWKSLNFITIGDIRRLASKYGLSVNFEPSQLYKSLRRIESDEIFAKRKSGLILKIVNGLKKTNFIKLLKYLPPSIDTPMLFHARHIHKKGIYPLNTQQAKKHG